MSQNITESQISAQEHLSTDRLNLLLPKYEWDNGMFIDRPKSNLVDLMHWVRRTFGPNMGLQKNLQCWIHNKIVMDGSFMQFAEETGIKIECLYADSCASWKMNKTKHEHFMAQGVWKISTNTVDFLHAALFHKGNQNEDEVSFFVVMEKDNFEKYVELRNSFDEWLSKRDRNQLEIHVVGGEGISYTKEASWDDVYLPDNVKTEIKDAVEGFLNSKELYESRKMPWKRGVLFYGEPGNGKSTLIRTIIANYDVKPVTVNSSRNTSDDTVTEAFYYAQEQGPSVLFFEDLDTIFQTVSVSHFLNLLDGVSTKSGVFVIATANDISKILPSVTDRPSRFDRKILIPLPDSDMAEKYMRSWFGEILTDAEYKKLSKKVCQEKFSYAYLKELYITSAFRAIANKRQSPNSKDIAAAMSQLVSDKKSANTGFKTESDQPVDLL